MLPQPLSVVERRRQARALIVQADTLAVLQDWIRDEATDGTQANLIGAPPAVSPSEPGMAPALYLSHPDASGFHRCADGEVVVIDERGHVTLHASHEAFLQQWERPARGSGE